MTKDEFKVFIDRWQFKQKVFQDSLNDIDTALNNVIDVKYDRNKLEDALKILKENIKEHKDLMKSHDRSIFNTMYEDYFLC